MSISLVILPIFLLRAFWPKISTPRCLCLLISLDDIWGAHTFGYGQAEGSFYLSMAQKYPFCTNHIFYPCPCQHAESKENWTLSQKRGSCTKRFTLRLHNSSELTLYTRWDLNNACLYSHPFTGQFSVFCVPHSCRLSAEKGKNTPSALYKCLLMVEKYTFPTPSWTPNLAYIFEVVTVVRKRFSPELITVCRQQRECSFVNSKISFITKGFDFKAFRHLRVLSLIATLDFEGNSELLNLFSISSTVSKDRHTCSMV